jgi:ribonucleotide reductase alpha subunit
MAATTTSTTIGGEMYVTKRNGEREEMNFNKILVRIKTLSYDLTNIQFTVLTMKVIDQLTDNIATTLIDELTSQQCASMASLHADYMTLAGRIVVSNLHKATDSTFYAAMEKLYGFRDVHGDHHPIISDALWDIVQEHRDAIDAMIVHQRDYDFDYFGFKTLERAYLTRINTAVVERPQYMWMRVALGLHGANLDRVRETYELMSCKYFTHATPTLFNAGMRRPQLSSCFLVAMAEDSIEGIYDTLKDCACISKWSGGIGLHIHNIRSANAYIRGTNGHSNGIVPMLRNFNDTARYVNQGGKRNGSFAVYLEPWHADIEDFLELRKNHGDENMRSRDLFYGLWIPDLYMERVDTDGDWSLFCPDTARGLYDVVGPAFKTLYESYELNPAIKRKTIKARALWFKILDAQMETGTPYLLYKDACNLKSNQRNLGTIKSSNLCTEIVEFSSADETAVCNLASISLAAFVHPKDGEDDAWFDYNKMHEVVKVVTTNLNAVIDLSYYPTAKTRNSNLRHRPLGIGVQGLADTFIQMNLSFTSEKAREVNRLIFETIYHAAVERSCEIAEERCAQIRPALEKLKLRMPALKPYTDKDGDVDVKASVNHVTLLDFNVDGALDVNECELTAFYSDLDHCGAYSSFAGSPASQGELQFDLWLKESLTRGTAPPQMSDRYDWSSLKARIMASGMRNSLLVAPMPTASTSQILGNNECFEPITSNIYSRTTIAGEFTMVNRYLVDDLSKLGMWNTKIRDNIIANKGSVQQLDMVPADIREKYKTVWEISMRNVIDMAADRGAFICQSQSMNLWQEDPDYGKLSSMHMYAWKKGLKTGMYYLRRKARHQAQQFTIEPELSAAASDVEEDEPCLMCAA